MLNLTNKIINPEKLSYEFFPKSSKNSKGMQVIKATDTKRSIRFHSVIYTIKKLYSTTSLYTCWGEAFWQEDILDIVDKFIKENLK